MYRPGRWFASGSVHFPVRRSRWLPDYWRHHPATIGPPEIQKPTSLTGRGGLWLQVGDRQVHIGVEDGVNRYATKAHIAYEVSNLEEWKRKVATLGFEVIDSIPLPGHDRFEFPSAIGSNSFSGGEP